MPDHRYIEYLYFFSSTGSVWRNDNGDLDRDGCLWPGPCTGNKNHHGNPCSAGSIYDTTCGSDSGLRCGACGTCGKLYELGQRHLFDIRNGDGYPNRSCDRMRGNTDGLVDLYGCV